MGTHPIFESDFDCLTDFAQNDKNYRYRGKEKCGGCDKVWQTMEIRKQKTSRLDDAKNKIKKCHLEKTNAGQSRRFSYKEARRCVTSSAKRRKRGRACSNRGKTSLS